MLSLRPMSSPISSTVTVLFGKAAFDENRFVPLFLLDLQPLPEDPPEYISLGGESEAVSYVFSNGAYWIDTPGAFEWFVGQFKVAVDELEKHLSAEETAFKLQHLMGH